MNWRRPPTRLDRELAILSRRDTGTDTDLRRIPFAGCLTCKPVISFVKVAIKDRGAIPGFLFFMKP